jgi:hypothetical protein
MLKSQNPFPKKNKKNPHQNSVRNLKCQLNIQANILKPLQKHGKN